MKLSLIKRWTHMYLGLVLMPWMLMYAISAIVMNHLSSHHYGIPKYEKEAEKVYTKTFADDIEPQMMAEQILADLGLAGSHYFQEYSDKTGITIHRYSPVRSRRITYTFADKKLVIERLIFQINPFLRHMHVRRGYQHKYVTDNAWAVSVDLVTFAMLFWIVSGSCLWYRLKATRRWGIVCSIAGAALFVFLVCAL